MEARAGEMATRPPPPLPHSTATVSTHHFSRPTATAAAMGLSGGLGGMVQAPAASLTGGLPESTGLSGAMSEPPFNNFGPGYYRCQVVEGKEVTKITIPYVTGPLPCPHNCGRTFRHASQRILHVRKRHTGETPFACEHQGCDRKFHSSGELRSHKRSHTGEKLFTCEHCGKKVGTKNALQYHVRALHTLDRPFKCDRPGCNVTYMARVDLDRHEAKHVRRDEEEKNKVLNQLRKHVAKLENKNAKLAAELELSRRAKKGKAIAGQLLSIPAAARSHFPDDGESGAVAAVFVCSAEDVAYMKKMGGWSEDLELRRKNPPPKPRNPNAPARGRAKKSKVGPDGFPGKIVGEPPAVDSAGAAAGTAVATATAMVTAAAMVVTTATAATDEPPAKRSRRAPNKVKTPAQMERSKRHMAILQSLRTSYEALDDVKRKVNFQTYRRSLSTQQVVELTPGLLRPDDVPDDYEHQPPAEPAPALRPPPLPPAPAQPPGNLVAQHI